MWKTNLLVPSLTRRAVMLLRLARNPRPGCERAAEKSDGVRKRSADSSPT